MRDPLRAVLISRHLKASVPKVHKNPQKPAMKGAHMVRLLGSMKKFGVKDV